jgi:hypothetical protein
MRGEDKMYAIYGTILFQSATRGPKGEETRRPTQLEPYSLQYCERGHLADGEKREKCNGPRQYGIWAPPLSSSD